MFVLFSVIFFEFILLFEWKSTSFHQRSPFEAVARWKRKHFCATFSLEYYELNLSFCTNLKKNLNFSPDRSPFDLIFMSVPNRVINFSYTLLIGNLVLVKDFYASIFNAQFTVYDYKKFENLSYNLILDSRQNIFFLYLHKWKYLLWLSSNEKFSFHIFLNFFVNFNHFCSTERLCSVVENDWSVSLVFFSKMVENILKRT